MNQIVVGVTEPHLTAFELLARVVEHNAIYADRDSPAPDVEAIASIWLPLFRSQQTLEFSLSAAVMCVTELAEIRPGADYPVDDEGSE
jgi:hypothetical protein